ncbi:MAG: hypothetical protein LWW77_12690 [Propionibacteriales bacterium]|nr:hypothetical protein [Propionibacteriales bacterium]
MAEANQRQRDAQRRQELADAAARAEAVAAQQQIDAFVAALRDAGAATEPLQATLLNGQRVRTPLSGWYLNSARTVAVTPDGRYYLLVTTGSALARFTGVHPEPSTPSLVIGRGARDGESGDLADFLQRATERYTPPTG